MEKQESQKFIQWLAKKLKVKSQGELETAIKGMGEAKMKEAYQQFQQESQGGNQGGYAPEQPDEGAPQYKDGGKFEYLRCLKLFKKGGKMKGCGCGAKMQAGGPISKDQPINKEPITSKPVVISGQGPSLQSLRDKYGDFDYSHKVRALVTLAKNREVNQPTKKEKGGPIQKALFGAILNTIKGVGALATGAKVAGEVSKGANTLFKINKIAGGLNQAVGMAKNLLGPSNPGTPPSVQPVQQGVVPQTYRTGTVGAFNTENPQVMNPVTAQNPPVINPRAIPTFTPVKEDGGKLEKIQKLNKFKKTVKKK
jgi:hypothetical protein